MESGIEFFADRFDGLYSHLVELIHELLVYLVHSDYKRIIFVLFINRRKTSFEVVDNGKEFFENRCGSSVEGLCFFFFGTVPEVLKFRELSLGLILQLLDSGFEGFFFLIGLQGFLLGLFLGTGFLG